MIYFLSDIHLGSKAHTNPIDIERKLCRWLDSIRHDAKAIYLLGDIFDYWYEYKHVVPKGFVRILGKLAELTDSGIEIHFFVGNHDLWLTDYLAKECGLTLHFQPKIVEIDGTKIFLAHGDGLMKSSITRKMFHSKFLRACLSAVHPRWVIPLAHAWSNGNREKNAKRRSSLSDNRESEALILFSKQKLQEVPDIRYFIFGHCHQMLDVAISDVSRVIVLGDWIDYDSFAVLDDGVLKLKQLKQ